MKRLISTLGARLSKGAPAPRFGSKGTSTRTAAATQFQILSDLHLELGQQYSTYTFPATAPNLILAGDIGLLTHYDAYLSFLHKQTSRYERVFLVLGNHEYYGLDHATALSTAQKLEGESRLKGKLSLLQQTRVDLPGAVTVLGCTLWSSVPEEAKDVVGRKVNDFSRIEDWTVDSHNKAHKSDLTWLMAELDDILLDDSERSVLVVTHHAPSVQETSRPEHLGNPWTSAFATDILSNEEDEAWGLVKYWVYGHTHFSTEFEKCGIRVFSNQRGYVVPGVVSKKGPDTGFDAGRTIQVARGTI
ncbi:related to Ser/Thr protein phosphatase superfamily [Cephalotrichum gorgonifer]|uniref:Related to Ser/Thr protein phosphatase superfamily n=1 Tax=Cephalotrichum gorgonifer TaxID=2041049 RepID=A0AAE8N2J5_9PEZI|nr:related to Ser/Thr protein phosphatase superfamily [Cephalotrichum gorgonifer]